MATPEKKGKKRLLKWVLPALIGYIGPLMVVGAMAAIILSLVSPFLKVMSWFGFGGGDKAYVQQLADENLGGGSLKDTLTQLLDCRNVSPEDAKTGYCIETGYAEASPIPFSAEWLVPVWQAAGDKYKVPWQLLAAITAARTNFGDFDCNGANPDTSLRGKGFYRMDSNIWDQYKQDAGRAINGDSDGNPDIGVTTQNFKCYTSSDPSPKKWQVKDGNALYYDAVDSTFAIAQALHEAKVNITGAKAGVDPNIPDWSDYNGGDPGSCTIDVKQDGPVWRFRPDSAFVGSGAAGWNENLQLPDNILALGAKYTFATWTQPSFPALPGAVPGELLDAPERLRNDVIPKTVEVDIINAIGQALNMPPSVINSVRPGLMNAIDGESSFKTAIVQWSSTVDVNSDYPDRARGLFEFTPGTFWTWHVPGFNNIFNPVDNTLAAMVAMRFAGGSSKAGSMSIPGYGTWILGSGWGPASGTNPFAGTFGHTNVSSSLADASTGSSDSGNGTTLVSSDQKPVAYQGADPTDPISKAVRYLGGNPGSSEGSGCYAAIVHEWYQAILENPPGAEGGASGTLGKMIAVARSQIGTHEIPDGSNSGPQVNQYLASVNTAPGNFWCAAFVSWSAQQAGVKLGPDPADIGSAGVAQITQWANEKGIFTAGITGPPPEPGDLVAFGQNDHIGIIEAVHPGYLITIEGNASNQVEYVRRVPGSDPIMGYIRLTKLYGHAGAQTPDSKGFTADTSGPSTA